MQVDGPHLQGDPVPVTFTVDRDASTKIEGRAIYSDNGYARKMISAEAIDPRRIKWGSATIRFKLTIDSRVARRHLREAHELLRPHPLDGLEWRFPTWRVRRRPFDWAIDGPGKPDPTPMPYPEQARLVLPLSAPAPVVQR